MKDKINETKETLKKKLEKTDLETKGKAFLDEVKAGFYASKEEVGVKAIISRFKNLWMSGWQGKVAEISAVFLIILLLNSGGQNKKQQERNIATECSTTTKKTSVKENAITVTDIDGNVYPVVDIGSQTWMAENIRVTKYPNGNRINHLEDSKEWANLPDDWAKQGGERAQGAYCCYDNSLDKAIKYGNLYTISAALANNWNYESGGKQGICPDGWHLPNDYDWKILTSFLRRKHGKYKGGTLLKSTSGWKNDGNGSDEYGFCALPGGSRNSHDGEYEQIGERCFWWSADSHGYTIKYNDSDISGGHSWDGSSGLSVRCIKND